MRVDFDDIKNKWEARRRMVDTYRRLTARTSVPPSRQYWCLCGRQSASPKSEINQMIQLGLIKPGQFHGVDRSEDVIRDNCKTHPSAHFHCGEWLDELLKAGRNFKPGLVYLDTQATAGDRVAPWLTVNTMMMCPKRTVLFVNVCLQRRMKKEVGLEVLFDDILESAHTSELEKWEFEEGCIPYRSRYTPMATYMMRKERG